MTLELLRQRALDAAAWPGTRNLWKTPKFPLRIVLVIPANLL
jgi:hypothetical protein